MDIIDLFNQRLELKESHSTWNAYQCPLCSSGTVKLDKNSNKYKNWNCNCNTKRITALIFKDSGYKRRERVKEIPVVINPLPNISNVKLAHITNPPNIYELDKKYSDLENLIYYLYSASQRTIRINRTKKTGKKIIFPQIVVCSSSWINGIGDTIFPLFTNSLVLLDVVVEEDYIREKLFSIRPSFNGELVVVVEGEKCVEYIQSQGIECFSILNAYGYDLEKIKLSISSSKSFMPNLKQLLYIPDLDAVGIKKSVTFQQASWSLGIPCKIFDIRDKLLSPIGKGINFDKGYDIADYIQESPNSNLMEIFENEFSNQCYTF